MAPGREEFTKIARTQYFFFDACRNAPAALEKLDRTSCPYILDISERTAYDDRRKAVFQTTEPDRRAYADPNGLTHFAAALLKCLEGGVGVLDQTIIDPTQPRWNLTIGALDQGANYYLRIENDLRNVSQRAQPTITMSYDTIFCRLDAPPKVPYRVLLDPASACDYTLVELCAERDGLTWKLPKPVKPHPYDSLVSGGFYRYRATLDSPAGGAPLTSSPFLLQTPGALVKVVVSGLQS